MRWNEQRNERESAWASVVLPTPGTSSISRWPRASSAVSAIWITSSLPFTTRAIERSSSPSRALAFSTVTVVAGVLVGMSVGAVICNWRSLLLQKVSCLDGRLAQLVRALPSHGRGPRFKSLVAHQFSRLPVLTLFPDQR